ncbi:MAG TPA: AraC family transcriptional regulator [Candidatus Eisenbergiella merdipullorum]|uniref:AraC family transcriptional regulator n=1 Tax=Candidatus Eisenbergiella merdipullorum TaxID=2838553 RepID=A0A9D2I576_9FIRM|nr:AraC family transcriptional regulator [Candidatus Eisenbergiella merdipullorum]
MIGILDKMIVTSIQDVFTVDSHKGRKAQIRNRNSYGISFCYGGRITYYQDEKAVISDRNHMVLLPKGQDYTLYCDSSGLFPVINLLCTDDFQVTSPAAFPLHSPESCLKDYERLRELFFLKNQDARCMSILYRMIAEIAAGYLQENSALDTAMDFLEKHYSDPDLTNTVIADHLHISEVYFRKLFKNRYGITPRQYILELRIRKARQLLGEHRSSIAEIAEECGFSSIYHFSRAFRHAVGVSPTEYGRAERKEGI